MKILVFSDHFRPEPSAPAAHVYDRCRLWVEQGHSVTVLTSAPNFPEGRVFPGYRNVWRAVENLAGIRVVRLKTYIAPNEGTIRRTLDYISYMLTAFWGGFLEPRPDVVLSSSPHLFVAYAGALHAWLRRVPHVMEVRDLWPASLLENAGLRPGPVYRVLEWSELLLYRHSRRIIALTQGIRDDLVRRGVPETTVRLVMTGADLSLFTPRARDAQIAQSYGLSGRFVVGYVGTVGLSHGLENAIQAFNELSDTGAVLFIVGVGAARETLERQVAEQGIGNVVFAPRQLKEDVPGFWSVCDASLVHLRDAPVFRTAMPSKVFESMAMGLPILYCGPESPGAELVRSTRSGITVPAGNPAALADAVRRLMADPATRGAMASAAREAARGFSRETQATQCLAVLTEAVNT